MWRKVSAALAVLCIAVYLAALIYAGVSIVSAAADQRSLANAEFREFRDYAARQNAETFLSADFREDITAGVLRARAVQALIVTAEGRDSFAVEKDGVKALVYSGSIPGFNTAPFIFRKPLSAEVPVDGVRGVRMSVLVPWVPAATLLGVFRQALFALFLATAVSFAVLILDVTVFSRKKRRNYDDDDEYEDDEDDAVEIDDDDLLTETAAPQQKTRGAAPPSDEAPVFDAEIPSIKDDAGETEAPPSDDAADFDLDIGSDPMLDGTDDSLLGSAPREADNVNKEENAADDVAPVDAPPADTLPNAAGSGNAADSGDDAGSGDDADVADETFDVPELTEDAAADEAELEPLDEAELMSDDELLSEEADTEPVSDEPTPEEAAFQEKLEGEIRNSLLLERDVTLVNILYTPPAELSPFADDPADKILAIAEEKWKGEKTVLKSPADSVGYNGIFAIASGLDAAAVMESAASFYREAEDEVLLDDGGTLAIGLSSIQGRQSVDAGRLVVEAAGAAKRAAGEASPGEPPILAFKVDLEKWNELQK